ncbi:MAG: phosphopantothenate--cysteine ligase [Clostridiales Family XIII bacterium]|jgi:phosphopantothenate-cysteine ligase|nr:phosphopantothenate--cysteine ligase [Clostridiales Family XIII bacterium]
MKKIKALVTSGGTSEKIDDVRKITNSGTGALGAAIAHRFMLEECVGEVTYLCSANAVRPSGTDKLRVRVADDVLSVMEAVKDELAENEYDIIVHSMAIGDYMLKAVTEPAPLAEMIVDKAVLSGDAKGVSRETLARMVEDSILDPHAIKEKKISSDKDSLVFVMVKAPKVIALFRGLAPNAVICGFKLLAGVGREELISVSRGLLAKNKLDIVLANDMDTIRAGRHKGLLIDKYGRFAEAEGKPAIADIIVHGSIELFNGRYDYEQQREEQSED